MEFNPAFTKNELYHFLVQRGVEEDDAKKLQEEKIDGETFQDITETDLREIGVKLGTRKKIVKIIETFKQSLLQNAELQDLQILGGDSNLSNSLVFDLIAASPSCTVIPAASPTISSTTSLASIASKLLPSSSSTAEKPPAVTKGNFRSFLKKKKSSFVMETLPPRLYNSTIEDLCTEDATGDALSIYADSKNIDVLAMLNKHTTGKTIINNLKSGIVINRSDINEIVRIVIHTMIEDLRTLYPTSTQKLNLAKAIVRDIPELKSNREGVEGYEQFYNPNYNSGSIEWRLKTLRVRVPASKKRKRKRSRIHTEHKDINEEKEEEFIIDDDTLIKVNCLKSQPAVEINKAEIFKNMEETFKVRRNFIVKKSPTIAEILEVFPQLKEFDGALIDADFKLIYPNAGNLLESFPMYSEKIRIYVSQKRHDIAGRVCHVKDENLKAMLYLADLLPIPGMRIRELGSDDRCHPSEAMITFTGENSPISQEDIPKHPRLLCCGEVWDEQLQFFLVLDKEYIDLGKCFVKAFDIFYKSYKVFNVEYPKILSTFYSFLETIIYKINTGAVRSNVEHLNNVLCCVNTNS